MLAYYVEWHMREAWRALLFADEEQHPQWVVGRHACVTKVGGSDLGIREQIQEIHYWDIGRNHALEPDIGKPHQGLQSGTSPS
jgi:hypothetical protein